jgi:dephospho-CoA kinase
LGFVVGLTGGIGSGKSAVAAQFAKLGAEIVDTDAIAHELTAPGGAAIEPIRERFGAAVITGEGALDRSAMRRLVFSDPGTKRRLESILHPMIRAEADRRCVSALAAYVVLVVPLLVETGAYRDRVARILTVDCAEATQIARTIARSGLSEPEVRAILASQASREARLAVADDVIDNEGDLDALRAQVVALHRLYLDIAGLG